MIGAAWNLLLGFAWIVLTGDFSGRNLLTGLLFGYLVLALIQSQVPALAGHAQRLPRLVRFVGFFLKELVMANLKVSYDIVTLPWYMRPGVIAMPLKASTEFEIAFVANLISLTPGTLSLDVSDDRRVLYIHAMFLDDEPALRHSLPDRVVALELFSSILVGIIGVVAIATDVPSLLDVAIVMALMAFMATIGFARFLERGGPRDD